MGVLDGFGYIFGFGDLFYFVSIFRWIFSSLCRTGAVDRLLFLECHTNVIISG